MQQSIQRKVLGANNKVFVGSPLLMTLLKSGDINRNPILQFGRLCDNCTQYFCVNALLHLEQASGFSPVWILSCMALCNNKLVTMAAEKTILLPTLFFECFVAFRATSLLLHMDRHERIHTWEKQLACKQQKWNQNKKNQKLLVTKSYNQIVEAEVAKDDLQPR